MNSSSGQAEMASFSATSAGSATTRQTSGITNVSARPFTPEAHAKALKAKTSMLFGELVRGRRAECPSVWLQLYFSTEAVIHLFKLILGFLLE